MSKVKSLMHVLLEFQYKWNNGDFGKRTKRGGNAFIREWEDNKRFFIVAKCIAIVRRTEIVFFFLRIGKGVFYVLIILVLFSPLKCNASRDILTDMYNNPSRYITYGHVGTGFTVLIDRNSLNVHLYNPPYYIIAVTSVMHYRSGRLGDPVEDVNERNVYTIRFRYDYEKKKYILKDTIMRQGRRFGNLSKSIPKIQAQHRDGNQRCQVLKLHSTWHMVYLFMIHR